MASSVDEEALHQLYLWIDNIPLSRPKRNLSRDFSDGVLVAELIKFYFPKMVEMHNYVPANSLQQKLSNWGHLNRKVLNKLNFSVPDDVMRKIAQCSPGVVELVLIPLRQRLEERQRRQKLGAGSLQELAPQDGSGYMDMGLSQKARGDGAPALGGEQLRGGRPQAPRPPGYNQALQGDPSFVLQIAEKEQELLASQETVQVLQMKVKRLEHLLQLKNVRIDDLSRRLQQAERKQRRKDHFSQPRKPVRTHGMISQPVSTLRLPALGLERRSSGSLLSLEDSPDSILANSPWPQTHEKLPPEAEGFSCPSWVLTWDPSQGWRPQQLHMYHSSGCGKWLYPLSHLTGAMVAYFTKASPEACHGVQSTLGKSYALALRIVGTSFSFVILLPLCLSANPTVYFSFCGNERTNSRTVVVPFERRLKRLKKLSLHYLQWFHSWGVGGLYM